MKKSQLISLTWISITVVVVAWTYIYSNIDLQSKGSGTMTNNIKHIIHQLTSKLVRNNKNQPQKFGVRIMNQSVRSFQRKKEELSHLRDLIHRRLVYLQNPSNCTEARKVVCAPNQAGFGSGLHQVTFCLIVAYATRRTLILKSRKWKYAKEGWDTLFLPISANCTSAIDSDLTYDIEASKSRQIIKLPKMQRLHKIPVFMPLAIPEDIADNLERVHMNPSLWWIGQFVEYLIRPDEDLKLFIQKHQEKVLSMRPIVGIHVRRTDKIQETRYFSVEEYMTHVEEWFEQNVSNDTKTKYVYIATDAASVLQEAKQKYPGYTFVYHESAMNVDIKNRYSVSSLKILLSEVHNLAMCDFVICTMSSNVCRFVRELKESREWNASERLVSLDRDYLFHIRKLHKTKDLTTTKNMTAPQMTKLITLNKFGKKSFQKYSIDIKKSRVVMPVYSEVKDMI